MNSTGSVSADEKLIVLYEQAVSRPVIRAEYRDDNGEWKPLPDVLGISVTARADDNRKTVYTLLPPSAQASLELDNAHEQYTPGSGGAYSPILRPGRKIRILAGYAVR